MESRRGNFSKALIFDNPLLVGGMGICSVAAVATTGRAGLLLGCAILVVTLVSAIITLVISKPFRALAAAYQKAAGVVVVAAVTAGVTMVCEAFYQDINLGIYMPLIGVNSMILTLCCEQAFKNKNGEVMKTSIGVALGYVILSVVVGIIREVLGYGMIFGHVLFSGNMTSFAIFTMIPGGLFVIACLAAFLNWIINNRREAENTIAEKIAETRENVQSVVEGIREEAAKIAEEEAEEVEATEEEDEETEDTEEVAE